MINSQDIKKGTCIRLDGKLYFCVDFLHVKPGKGNTIMRTTLKDVVKGGQIERRFNIGEKLEDVRVERRHSNRGHRRSIKRTGDWLDGYHDSGLGSGYSVDLQLFFHINTQNFLLL